MKSVARLLIPFVIAATGGSAFAQTSLTVFDVTSFGATGSCESDTAAIQSAIDAAHAVNGGTVYFPPGYYCVTGELLGYPNITLRGASLGVLDASSASVISTSSDFGPDKAVIRVANRAAPNYGFQVEDLSIAINTANPGVVGVDFSGVWYGAIRGVGVIGAIGADPRRVLSAGSIGFLFSDMDGPNLGLACFDNLIERTSVAGMDTAYRFLSAQGDETLNTLTNFWTADVMTGIWTSSVGNVGLSFRDGYMATGLQVAGRKAFKHTGGFPTIQTINIQTEFFDAPSDIPVSGGISSLGGLGLFVDGPVSGKRFTQLVSAADGYNCGSTSACPCRPGTYPPPPTLSFWASIPAGTALSAGSNEFTFYTFAFEEQTTPIADLYFTFHPTHTANIGQFFQLAGTNSVTTPYFSSFQTYTISLFVASAVTLTSDFVFLLEANTTSQSPIAGSCLYPPTL